MYYTTLKRLSLLVVQTLLVLSASRCLFAQQAVLSWNASPQTNVAGYKLYYGTAPQVYTTVVNLGLQTSYSLTGLASGTYYFSVTAYNSSGQESGFSNEVSKAITTTSEPPPPPPTSPPPTGGVVLIDFGSTNGSNLFGLAGWNTVLMDTYTENRPTGPGGATIVLGDNWTYNYQGVSGSARSFAQNEKIVITWYNSSASSITFTPAISFTDGNRRNVDPAGSWYDLASLTIPALGTGRSEFVFTAATAGSFNMVNVNGNFQNNQVLICDKIELFPSGQTTSSPLPAPTNVKVK